MDRFPDECEALIRAGALDELFEEMDRAINQAGFTPRSGQIVDASPVAAPRQRNTDEEKAAIKAGRTALGIWPDKPAKAAQKGEPRVAIGSRTMANDGRWTVKYSKAEVRVDGSKPVDIAIPIYGSNRMSALTECTGSPLVREAMAHADSAYRSAENERWLEAHGMTIQVHRKKPRARPMPQRTSRANGRKSVVRSKVEHVFAQQKARMGLTIRTIGIACVKAAVTLANIAYNMTRLRWLQSRTSPT